MFYEVRKLNILKFATFRTWKTRLLIIKNFISSMIVKELRYKKLIYWEVNETRKQKKQFTLFIIK